VAIARALSEIRQAILVLMIRRRWLSFMEANMSDLIVRVKRLWQETAIVVTHDNASCEKSGDRVNFLAECRVGFFERGRNGRASKDPVLRNFSRKTNCFPRWTLP